MKRHKHARLMLQLARRDLKALDNMNDPDKFDDAVFGFFAQQVAEKALKGWVSLVDAVYPKTHDIRILLRLLEKKGISGLNRYRKLADLTDFAVEYRYDLFEYSALSRDALLKSVRELVEHVEELMEGEI